MKVEVAVLDLDANVKVSSAMLRVSHSFSFECRVCQNTAFHVSPVFNSP